MQASAGVPLSGNVPASFARSAIRHALAKGHDCNQMLRTCGIDPMLLENDQTGIPIDHYVALMAAVMRALNDEFLGYAPVPSKLGTWQMACLSSVHPGSVGHAIGRLFKFYRLLERGLRPQLVVEGDDAVIELVQCDGGPEWDLYLYERSFGAVRLFVTWLLKSPPPLRLLTLPHERPEHAAEYRWMFPGAEIAYRRPRATLRFDRSVLDAPVQRDECDLDQFLLNPDGALLAAAGTEGSWTARIREVITRELPYLPEFEDVATRLAIHPQTLRRRLAQEGLSYNDIKNQVRCGVAEYYLSKQTLSVEEVAFRSGFSEASSFIRAFRRWTGTTPTAYAQSQRSRVARTREAPERTRATPAA